MKDFNIVVLDGYTLNPGDITWDRFSAMGRLTVYDRTSYDASTGELIIERARGAQAVLINKTPMDREVLDALEELKYIGVLATGYNVVDVDYAAEKGVTVTNIPAYGTTAVAQMTIALLLELCHHVGEHSASVSRGEWQTGLDWCYWKYPLIELAGKTLGIIGYGKIGKATGKIAQALGMKILAFDQVKCEDAESETVRYVRLDELFSESDVISLHCPLFENTRGIINKDSIEGMKDGVLLINTSRGQLIVEQDLADALNSGKVGGAAVDVVSSEPIKSGNPLLKAENCIITPHIAWAPREARMRLMDIAAGNLEAFLSGKPVNMVNHPERKA